MKRTFPIVQTLNVLSIDVALGAVSSSIFFSTVFHKPLSFFVLLSLGLTVWIIYTADHLLDVGSSQAIVISERHKFHQRNYNALKWVVLSAALIDIMLATQLSESLVIAGVALGILATGYLTVSKRLGAAKELLAAIFYTSGICLPTMIVMTDQLATSERLLVTQFFCAALINLVLFALIEKEEDKMSRFTSIATLKGPRQVSFLLILLFLVSLGLFLTQQQLESPWQPSAILFTLDAILGALFIFRKSPFVKKYHRLIGDGAFVLPASILIS